MKRERLAYHVALGLLEKDEGVFALACMERKAEKLNAWPHGFWWC